MGFKLVPKSIFVFKTDIMPSSRSTHPSGVLHVSSSSPPTNGTTKNMEQHAFAWIVNSHHIDSALPHLEKAGFKEFVFIPYSSKQHWLDRYPHAPLVLECDESGKIVGELVQDLDIKAMEKNVAGLEGTTVNEEVGTKRKKKYERRRSNKQNSMLHGVSALTNADRDELHIEIYNYFSWLSSKLVELEQKAEAEAADKATEASMSDDEADSEEEEKEEEVEEEEVDSEDVVKRRRKKDAAKKLNPNKSIDVTELQGMLEKMEYAFSVIPIIKIEAAEAAAAAGEEGQESAAELPTKGAPFLEEALAKSLVQLVEARQSAGKLRRSRKRIKRTKPNAPTHNVYEWDEYFERLVAYKEEQGDCLVPIRCKDDPELGRWVLYMRTKKNVLQKRGIEVEEVLPGRKELSRTLTAERIEKLNSIGFVWSILAPKVDWEDRFQELMDYRQENGKWPSQSMGGLGQFVHKQRQLYNSNDENFMKKRAPRLDEVGFEWTPRGNTKLKWEDGFEMLMAFGRIHGHFDVPCPPPEENGKSNTKSDAYKLYSWVNSLHGMYRSYKLGRQSGSLDDERVVLLIKHGFVFRRT